MAEARVVHVGGASPYDVVIGHDVLDRLPGLLGPGVRRVALCHAPGLGDLVDRVRDQLDGLEVLDLPLPDGEHAKTAVVAAEAWEALGEAGFTRSDAVVTVGGGATTDMGGFIAATWLRGVPVVHVPTTLLAMVDAAVGGKTGMNTGAGKNLVGSFHEPAGVLCDLDALATLPRPELVAGLAEVVKCGFIADPGILALVEADPAAALDPASPALRELVERAVAVKVDVVVDDLRETGGRDGHPGREALNYGHTLAHAVERGTGYRVRHGEAVALGMVYVAELARRVGRLDDATADRHEAVLRSVGLPVRLADVDADDLGFEDLLTTMRVDKKARGDRLRFLVLDGLGRPTVLAGPEEDALRAAYDHVRRGTP
ncbi:3-dehydroquinate synthase [Marmoricola sp. Leaf446]|uniref:3-dehydroquinate synthase n=1 Tax=Marmoricola sp. Leaf446 TaxID=1736379 RepID=UPI0006FCA664|nr:3-dehydroquinate synthase [Marmoricola sp. Leaf446]KQT94531.1 3-dehydroquinate synthase [Marmoricola sp. Leaf446]